MSDIFQQFSDKVEADGQFEWPRVKVYGAGNKICASTYLNGTQQGMVWTLPNGISEANKKQMCREAESEFREQIKEMGTV